MYCNFFGFSDKPFEVTADPKFLYLSPSMQEILTAIIYGIQERRGFITLIGEAGTGKTIILNKVLEQLPATTKVAFIFNTSLTFKQMFLTALIDFGIIKSQKNVSISEAVLLFNKFASSQLAKGGNVALILDEAQNLKQHSLENLRLLSNLETSKHKLVQILLCGQPELDAKLSRPKLRQLAQRISLRRFSKPFNEKETYDYIEHRLAIVNYDGNQLFNPDGLKLIWEYSRGIPRKINTLCDNALLIGYALEKKQIESRIVKEATRDLSKHPHAESNDYNAFQITRKKTMLL